MGYSVLTRMSDQEKTDLDIVLQKLKEKNRFTKQSTLLRRALRNQLKRERIRLGLEPKPEPRQ